MALTASPSVQSRPDLAPWVLACRAHIGVPADVWLWPVASEAALLAAWAWLVRAWDVDMLVGYEVQKDSLGYVLERAVASGAPLAPVLSRVPVGGRVSTTDKRFGIDTYGASHGGGGGGIWIVGRMVLNVWHLMKTEVKVNRYDLHTVVRHVLRRRVPSYSHASLTTWFSGDDATPATRCGAPHSSWSCLTTSIWWVAPARWLASLASISSLCCHVAASSASKP